MVMIEVAIVHGCFVVRVAVVVVVIVRVEAVIIVRAGHHHIVLKLIAKHIQIVVVIFGRFVSFVAGRCLVGFLAVGWGAVCVGGRVAFAAGATRGVGRVDEVNVRLACVHWAVVGVEVVHVKYEITSGVGLVCEVRL